MIKRVIFLIFLTIACSAEIIPDNPKDSSEQECVHAQSQVLEEIESLLKDGVVPTQDFKKWISESQTILDASSDDTIKKLAGLLQNLVTPFAYTKLDQRQSLVILINAIRVYHPRFTLNDDETFRAVKCGVRWFKNGQRPNQ